MDIIKKKKEAYFYLLLTSLLTFFLWRYEVEYHGWAGLIWLDYFHKAIPVCLLLFVAWFVAYVEVASVKWKLIYVGLLIGIGTLAIFGMLYVLFTLFGAGSRMSWGYIFWSTWELILFLYLPSLLLLFLPLVLFIIIQSFNYRIPFKYVVLSQFLFWAAPFVCIELIALFPWQARADFIHIFKTGYIYPFWFFAVGFPLVHAKKKQPRVEIDVLDAP